jgi:histidyl-tRNA synthetase
MKRVRELRDKGVACELYPTSAKLQKQMKYANDRNVKFVALVGENELKDHLIQVKNMTSGEQFQLSVDDLLEFNWYN